MTYCVGLLVGTGLVMLSDSRTNAGVDQRIQVRQAHHRASDYPQQQLGPSFKCAHGVHGLHHPFDLSVGPPLDLCVMKRDEFKLSTHISLDLKNDYFKMLRERWGFAPQEVFSETQPPLVNP